MKYRIPYKHKVGLLKKYITAPPLTALLYIFKDDFHPIFIFRTWAKCLYKRKGK